ncbi:MAG: hypothetical protein JWN62_1004 [Acidimicrobiales bacterium]|nr:hypothetical protein [Acidimicrobiales bacterium]
METVAVVDLDDEVSLEWLGTEICRRSANMTAAEAGWLALVADFDRRRGWLGSGSRSCAAWLSWQTGVDLCTAHEKVRVAHALDRLPQFAVAMQSGQLSYAKVRSITRIASEPNADWLLQFALGSTSNHVERMVSAYRRSEVTAEDAEQRAFEDRSMRLRLDGDSVVTTLRLPVEAGSVFIECVDRFVEDFVSGESMVQRRADAAFDMAIHAVATIADPAVIDDAHLVTLHLTPDVFDDPDDTGARDGHVAGDGDAAGVGEEGRGCCAFAPGDGLGTAPAGVPRESARRILCDAVLQGFRHTDGGDDGALGQGRRTVSRRLKRLLRLRDHGCRFPGCQHTAWLDAHHIVHWLQPGPTIQSNLICLCRMHHRLMHEGGWSITGDPRGDLWFLRPDGSMQPAEPIRVDDVDGDLPDAVPTPEGDFDLEAALRDLDARRN